MNHISDDRASWKHVYTGALYALGCDPADVVLDMLTELTHSPEELRAAIAHMRALPAAKHTYPGFVNTGLDFLRACRAGKRIAVRLSELREGDILVYNEGTPIPVVRMRVVDVAMRPDGSAYVSVCDVGNNGFTGRGRSLYAADEVLQVERPSSVTVGHVAAQEASS
jgi:hypothetical protein